MTKQVASGLVLCILICVSPASADFINIGTANYGGNDYNLIYEDTQELVWLDYTRGDNTWANQGIWASELGSGLIVTLNPGYTTTIDWTAGWRLPKTVDNIAESSGFDITTSEMGHLYYESLQLEAVPSYSGKPLNTDSDLDPFSHLRAKMYWSGTEYAAGYEYAPGITYGWCFGFANGGQTTGVVTANYCALAVHEGTVSAVPVPGAALLGMLGLGTAAGWLKRRRIS